MGTLAYERWYPLVAAILLLAGWIWLGQPFPADGKEFLSTSVSFSAILIGFLATTLAILMALPKDSIMGELRNSGYLPDLTRYMREALAALGIFAIIGVLGFFLPTSQLPGWFKIVWFFFAMLSLFAAFRMIAFILKLLEKL